MDNSNTGENMDGDKDNVDGGQERKKRQNKPKCVIFELKILE